MGNAADTLGAQGKPLGRAAWYRILLHFALARGRTPVDATRLLYHLALKPSLVFHGRTRFDTSRILCFRARGLNGKKLKVHARDNGSDVGTFEEFFSRRYQIIPPELPPISPGVIYDIGANIGIASLYFGCAFPQARIIGFEPVPDNLEVCRLNYLN